MNVLSLFDGMSCGRVALERCGFNINNYYAAEIDKYAIQVALNNYPDTIPIGDVTKVKAKDLGPIDLLIGGSPCQGFSFAGKQLNFGDPRSMLFFEFVRLLKDCKPKYFFLENVVMKKEYQDVISKYLGVEPIMLNSSLVSAQSRKRLYWTNIPGYTPPEDKGILLKNIVHENCETFKDKSQTLLATMFKENAKSMVKRNKAGLIVNSFNINPSGKGMNGLVQSTQKEKLNCLTTNKGEGQKIGTELNSYIVPFDKTLQILDKEVARGKVGYFRKDSQANRVYYIHDKAVTLCGDAGGGAAKMGQYLFGEVMSVRDISRGDKIDGGALFKDDDKSHTLTTRPDHMGLLFGCITPDRIDKRQNGQRFNDGTKFYTLTAQDRHGILIEGYIRKLTPIECERLQTLPDNYTAGVSNSQRYKMLGNGWTVDAVCEFFKHLPKDMDLF